MPGQQELQVSCVRWLTYWHAWGQVVATYHGDQAYAFDVTGAGVCSNVFVRPDGAPQGEATSAARYCFLFNRNLPQ